MTFSEDSQHAPVRLIAVLWSVPAVTAVLLLVACARLAPLPGGQTITPTPTPTPTPPAFGQGAVPAPTSGTSPATTYRAFASALASDFTKGDICSLEAPFHLEGNAPGVSRDLKADFTPITSEHGTFTYTQYITAGDCEASSKGTYEVEFRPNGEGDILLSGPITWVCKGQVITFPPSDIRVAIQPALGIICPVP